jgi:ubiquinone biosynthesis protein COQ9
MTDETDDKAIAALFRVAARDGWHRTSLAAIAGEAGLPLAELRRTVAGREALLQRFLKRCDIEVLEGTLPRAEGETVRDRLFDMVMRRLDILQRHRPGVITVMRAARRDPLLGLALLPYALAGATWMLEAAGADATGPIGTLRAKGLLAVLVYTLGAWAEDETADLAPTMAALDRALNRADQAEGWVSRLPGAGPRPAGPDAPSGEARDAPSDPPPAPPPSTPPQADPGFSAPPAA